MYFKVLFNNNHAHGNNKFEYNIGLNLVRNVPCNYIISKENVKDEFQYGDIIAVIDEIDELKLCQCDRYGIKAYTTDEIFITEFLTIHEFIKSFSIDFKISK